MADNYDVFLKKIAYEGLNQKGLSDSSEHIERLEYELGVIKSLGFAPYFLTFWDIVKWCKENKKFTGPGRGSAAGSLVNYCLGITKLDPVKYGLFFERFLNPGRVGSHPDIDFDLADRDSLILYLEDKYGKDKVARVGSINFLRTKSAVKDVGRVLDERFAFVEKLSALVPPPTAGQW